jgi:glycosyltransferase involved in cell wall biosynthesis
MSFWSSAKQLARRLLPPVYRNVNQTSHSKRCLVLYITRPFRETIASTIHQNRWQVRELARIVGEFGYNVDVIDWYHSHARLRGSYELVIDVRPGHNAVYQSHIADGGIRVGFLTTSNPAVSNRAERDRLDRIARSRGMRLKPRWYIPPFSRQTLESCGAVWLIGNRQTLSTYGEFVLPPVSLVQNTGYPFLHSTVPSRKSPKSFLFLGSRGQVHKGLDLLLEAFAGLQQLKLYVCGHFAAERDFCEAYRKELFQTANIVPVGFLDITGDRFRSLAAECSYVVMPSCAEGTSGSVLTGMSAGLIPLVSRECGFDDGDVHHLEECSVACIRDTVESLSRKSADWIRDQSVAAIHTVRARYSPECYTRCIEKGMQVLGANRT